MSFLLKLAEPLLNEYNWKTFLLSFLRVVEGKGRGAEGGNVISAKTLQAVIKVKICSVMFPPFLALRL